MASDEGRDVLGDAVLGEDADAVEHGAVQEVLPLDEPVPYRLTTRGRRLVSPEALPTLRVVPDLDEQHVDLDARSGTNRARARALRRTGMHTLDIAEELEVEPLHVEAWVNDLPVPPGAGRDHRRRQLAVVAEQPAGSQEAAGAVADTWRDAARDAYDEAVDRLAGDPGLRTGLALLSGVLELDTHALVLVGDQPPVLAAALRWVRTALPPADAPVRALVRHGPAVAGDRVAHDVATALGLDLTAVATTRDPRLAERPPQVRVRCSDPVLAGRVAGWQRALLADIARDAATP